MATTESGYAAGIRVGLGLGVPTFVMAITFGAMAHALGWGILAPVACSLLVFSGSAQFAMVTALAGGGGIGLAVGAAAMINARFLPMGIAVAGDLKGGRLRRALEGQAVVDASWAAAHQGNGEYDREKMFAATLVQLPAWVLGTLLGALTAPSDEIIHRFGLDVVFPAFFLVLLIDEIRGSARARLVAASAAVLAAVLTLVVPIGLAIIGSGGAALIGLRAGSAVTAK
ncbi:AzlC family ABC transporter permease [Kibdelosporangium phytohabitans]|uniref:Branched-chain amino acid permease n=1 Tax=Kibdelosporangium phytohabitans TaxID=860235 RepID=A0A0N9HTP4_9PSEU|nr:AzlC family ABC transporter permease [Kibdelosporangium phytohabitans]ALG08526.1 branched-chain amino acid permease [Kibdelosporangium phytohabitans]MBE1470402.1 4-azaleucine resistance transporter AzlC [Kibdelosporangium phytohabitans]